MNLRHLVAVVVVVAGLVAALRGQTSRQLRRLQTLLLPLLLRSLHHSMTHQALDQTVGHRAVQSEEHLADPVVSLARVEQKKVQLRKVDCCLEVVLVVRLVVLSCCSLLLALLLVVLKLKLSAGKLLKKLAHSNLLLASLSYSFPCGFRVRRKNALGSELLVFPS